jgi:hypothetical protein
VAGDLPPQETRSAPGRPRRGCLVLLTPVLLVATLIAALFTYGPLGIGSPLGARFWEIVFKLLLGLLVVCSLLLVGIHFFWLRSGSQQETETGSEPPAHDPH